MRSKNQGSITVELIVMLGLISALTPILYKQVTERREEIENINEANKLLLLKEATERYIEENKDTLSVGSMVIDPLDVGIDISGYSIGIKKDSEGNVDTMIVGNANNDLQAAKIASLLGVSAGIYSAQDTTKAWGINGVWAEDISNYGFTSIPTGVPVVTTAYDKDDGINLDSIINSIIETDFDKLSAKEICLGGECITEWIEATATPLQLIINCNMGDKKSCKRAYQKGKINYNCEAIGKTFKENDGSAQSGLYTFSLDESTYTQNNLCFFINNQAVTAETIITECNNDGSSEYCRLGYTYNINRSCEEVIRANPNAASGYYNLTNSTSYVRTPCLFVNKRIATSAEAISQCTTSGSFACAYGWYHNLNRSCERIIASNSSATTGFYFITTGSSGTASSTPCVFYNGGIASNSQVIIQCNAANNTNNAACRYGYNKNLNRNCSQVISNYPSGAGNNNTITAASSVSVQFCINCSSSRVIASNVSSGTFEAPCSGSYSFTVNGVSTPNDYGCGIKEAQLIYARRNSGSGIFSAGTKFTVKILPGTRASQCTHYSSLEGCLEYVYGSLGKDGIGVYNGSSLLISASGAYGRAGDRARCTSGGAGGSTICNLSNCEGSQRVTATKALATITFSP